MADLCTFLLNESQAAVAGGREPCFHMSPTLSTAVDQVAMNGAIAHSEGNGQLFLDFIDTIGLQFHAFNLSKTVAFDAPEFEALDIHQKFTFTAIMDEVIGEDTLIVGDGIAPNRLFIGPLRGFQQFDPFTGAYALRAAQGSVIPTFQLNGTQTWAGIAFFLNNGGAMPPLPPQQQHLTTGDASTEASTPASTENTTDHIPRPPNPFIIYRAAHHRTVSEAHPDASNIEISKKIGRQWQSESEEVRDAYRKKAADIKAAFMIAHPDYKYHPRKSSEVKRRAKKNVDKSTNAQSNDTLSTTSQSDYTEDDDEE
ncbi:hypothetical protein M406DRAFT_44005 [Cryphonectria parasitica EP155]|uniref:HMG box domain-containing protein n=2 Tax=Cryphonectria parasitica TaxID=5116 RepID=A0A9P4Y8G6_CRYP1|nr:uncharacterized protein M406DRAFT_44005 [Cryphonectria parasitica EP155]AAK83343.1 mating type protein MAT1-2-1 [Cryphonectria parasitica]KAF3768416.1 hypothetical protein M406DRAFT_44005 [Cryphonectria parasitica EP155]